MKIGFIGFGNMGQALGTGFILKNAVEAEQIYVYDKYQKDLKNNSEFSGVNICSSEIDLVEKVDMVIIAVKPNTVEEVIERIKEALVNKVLVSLVVNYLFDQYEQILMPEIHHISILPNIPVSVGEGAIVYENKHSLTDDELKAFTAVFSKIALLQEVNTNNMGIAGTITACGPALASMFIEALSDAAVKHGLPRELSYNLVSQMLVGTGKLQLDTATHPAVIKDKVCSPGGTTIKAVAALEKNGFRNAVIEAVCAACKKSEELGKK